MQLTAKELRSIRDELSRSAIRDALFRYCRGVDRADATILMSAYHTDAYDDHGKYRGPAHEFIATIVPRIRDLYIGMQHTIDNILIDLEGPLARVESYFVSTLRYRATPEVISSFGGRYLDQFECRQEEWKIARRTVVHDWSWSQTATEDLSRIEGYAQGDAGPGDPLYDPSCWITHG